VSQSADRLHAYEPRGRKFNFDEISLSTCSDAVFALMISIAFGFSAGGAAWERVKYIVWSLFLFLLFGIGLGGHGTRFALIKWGNASRASRRRKTTFGKVDRNFRGC